MGESSARSAEERDEICLEIQRRIRALPDMNDKGKLQGMIVRLRNVRNDGQRFEDEFRKLAALTQKIAREDPAGRLRESVERFMAHR